MATNDRHQSALSITGGEEATLLTATADAAIPAGRKVKAAITRALAQLVSFVERAHGLRIQVGWGLVGSVIGFVDGSWIHGSGSGLLSAGLLRGARIRGCAPRAEGVGGVCWWDGWGQG